MVAATIGGPLLPPEANVTTWLGNVVHARGLAGSILGNGRVAEAAFLLPATAALAIAAWPGLKRLASEQNARSSGDPEAVAGENIGRPVRFDDDPRDADQRGEPDRARDDRAPVDRREEHSE